MNENLNRLSDRINHLENVVTNLTESLPELARQLGSEIRQGICSLLFEGRLSFWDAATDGHVAPTESCVPQSFHKQIWITSSQLTRCNSLYGLLHQCVLHAIW